MTDQELPVDPSTEAKEMFQSQVTRWRRLWLITFLSLVMTLASGWYTLLQVISTANDTNRSVEILEKATGPDAQKQQGEVVQGLVVAIDCNFREALQEALDQIAPERAVVVLSEECSQSTTTTGG